MTRYGFLHVLLKRREWKVNYKRLCRLYRQEILAVRRLKRKRLLRASVPMAQLERANREWALDFVMDGLATGRALRVLTILDGYTPRVPGDGSGQLPIQPACYAGAGVYHRAARRARNSTL
jgi:hypothetical protein